MKTTPNVTGWLALPLVALFCFILPCPTWVIDDVYSKGIYRWWQGGVTSISNLAPFAWLDVFLITAVTLVLSRFVLLIQAVKHRGIVSAVWECARRMSRAAGALLILFLVMWGLNYRRTPLEAKWPYRAAPSVEALRTVIYDANAVAARVRPQAIDAPSFESVVVMLRAPLNEALLKLRRVPLETAGRPKYSLILTPFFTWAGVNGLVNPLALETIVHPDLLPFERPYSVAHEWAHLSGTADEAEASAIAWLACMGGPPDLAYSGSLYLIVEAGNALPISVWESVRSSLDSGVNADLDALARRLARQRPDVQRAASMVYDEYLRANRVEDGVGSYSRALSLILSPPLREALSSYRANPDRRP